MSNLRPFTNNGLIMYSLTTNDYFCFCNIYYGLLDIHIPLPWDEFDGFIMYHWLFLRDFYDYYIN